MKRRVSISQLAAISVLLVGSMATSATPPKDLHSRTEAEQVAKELINAMSESYDCAVSFDSIKSDLETDAVQYSVLVGLAGKECQPALQLLRAQGQAYNLRFGGIRDDDPGIAQSRRPNLDLIHEINPEIED